MARAGKFAKGAARRELILATASTVLARGGYRGTSLRSIARELDLEAANILYYFDSREDLLRAVIERWDADSIAACETEITPHNMLDLYAETIRRNLTIPGIVHLYLTFSAEAAHREHPAHAFFHDRFDALRAKLSAAVSHEQQNGLIDPAIDPDRAARVLIAVGDGVQRQSLADPELNAALDVSASIAQLRAGSFEPLAS